ncbi:MAG: DNA polymerase IV [Desulfobulbaceae bacterium]|nr:DNA polymerase IV [Desulfobulbaceae bacterium]
MIPITVDKDQCFYFINRKKTHLAMDIIHLDMDAFFASVEMRDNPDLLGKPVIVGGSLERGVVSAASYEARRFGVHSAMPIAVARRRCPQGIFLPVRMKRYQEVSAHIQNIFHRFTPLVEPLSLDEAFLDVTASTALFGVPAEIAAHIKQLIKEETGLTASAGVASSKLVAKIASDLEKPDGLTVVQHGTEQQFLAGLAIDRLWGVGKNTREILRMLGVKTIGDLTKLPEDLLEKKFGKNGARMQQAALGIDPRPVNTNRSIQSIGHEETFTDDLTDRAALHRELLAMAVKVGRRLRDHGLRGRTVTIKVKYYDFKQITRSITLPETTDDQHTIYQTGSNLLSKTDAGFKPVRLLGITVANLSSRDAVQQQLLFAADNRQRNQLNQAIDNITDKFDQDAIRPGTLL